MRLPTWLSAALFGAAFVGLALLPASADTKSDKEELKEKKAEPDKKADAKAATAALKGKEVQLTFKDTPVSEAIAQIAKKTGYKIKLHDPDGKMKDKKVTLDTGKTTFWDALTQFCDKAGLNDGDPNRNGPAVMPPPPGGGVNPQPLPPVRILPLEKPKPAERKEEKKGEKEGNAADEVKPVEAPPAPPAVDLPAQAGGPGAQPLPAPGGGPGGVPVAAAWVPVEPGEIVLTPAKAKKPADVKTSIRVRTAEGRMPMIAEKDHLMLYLEMTVEPRLRWYSQGAIKITKAVDDNDQKLENVAIKRNVRPMPLPLPPAAVPPGAGGAPGVAAAALPAQAGGAPGGGPAVGGGGVAVMPGFVGWSGANGLSRTAPLQFKKGKKETKSFKELSGTVEATVLTDAEEMIVADKVAKMEGKSVKGKKGGEISITKVTKEKDGTIAIEFSLEMPEKVQPEYQVNIPIPADALPVRQVRPLPAVVPPDAPPVAKAEGKPGNAADFLKEAPMADFKPDDAPAIAIARPAVQRHAVHGLTLQDDKGKPIYAQIQFDFNKMKNGVRGKQQKLELVARYKPGKGMPAEPTKLVFTARPVVELSVPFTLKDVEVK